MDVVKMAKKRHKIQEARLRADVDTAFAEGKAITGRRDTAMAINTLMKWLGYWLPIAAVIELYKGGLGPEFTLFWIAIGVLLVWISKSRRVRVRWGLARKVVLAKQRNHEEQLKWQQKILTGALSNQSRFNQRLDAKMRERRSENLLIALAAAKKNVT